MAFSEWSNRREMVRGGCPWWWIRVGQSLRQIRTEYVQTNSRLVKEKLWFVLDGTLWLMDDGYCRIMRWLTDGDRASHARVLVPLGISLFQPFQVIPAGNRSVIL